MKTTIVNDYAENSRYLLYNPILEDLAFTVNGSGHFFAGRNYFVERDSLKGMYLMLYTISGLGHIAYRGRELLLAPGQCILLNGEEYHRYGTASVSRNGWQFKWVRFKSEHAWRYDQLITRIQAIPIYMGGTSYEQDNDHILDLMSQNDPCKDMLLSDYASRMLTAMYLSVQKAGNSGHFSGQEMENSRQYIMTHFKEPLTVAYLAKMVAMTEAAYIRKFKQAFSSPPYAFLQKTRMNHAAFLLETSDLPIAEIGIEVGYSDQNNFSKQFRLYFHQSPSQYRRSYSMRQTNSLKE